MLRGALKPGALQTQPQRMPATKNVDCPSTLHIAIMKHELRQPSHSVGEKADSEGLMLSGNSGTLTDGAMTSPDSGASCLAQPGSAPHLLSMLRPDRRRRKRRRHPNRWQQRKPRRGIRQHILRIGDELADVANFPTSQGVEIQICEDHGLLSSRLV